MSRYIYSIEQKTVELLRQYPREPSLSIYMLHHVTDAVDESKRNLSITTDEFVRFISKKLDDGFVFISSENIQNSFNTKSCLLTFDDVCKDAYENALPELEKRAIPYLCFISPSFIGLDGYLSEYDVAHLRKSNFCTVGAHSLNHGLFRYMNITQKKIELSKEAHEEQLGCSINDFAFPYGSLYACDKESRQLASNEYQRVYSTINCKAIRRYGMGFLPRINLNSENVLYV